MLSRCAQVGHQHPHHLQQLSSRLQRTFCYGQSHVAELEPVQFVRAKVLCQTSLLVVSGHQPVLELAVDRVLFRRVEFYQVLVSHPPALSANYTQRARCVRES